jgi:hypothetical protein
MAVSRYWVASRNREMLVKRQKISIGKEEYEFRI